MTSFNTQPKCPYCGKPMDKPVSRKIIDRAYDQITRRQYVRTRMVEFCSKECGGNYQMGCEG
ncbi:hypothetical protein [Aquitalea magnusonii]|uniref:Uncharacterized protein n=1 Tax=Aquitalea magnusonii TaxID=332411 RepID=A0A318J6B1_9NEIS|nr:hypothetical protein [Aquitalea magnusonii]PXX42249.1 hypothetical protein DFR38_12046 [Aquitalea magnusonii]